MFHENIAPLAHGVPKQEQALSPVQSVMAAGAPGSPGGKRPIRKSRSVFTDNFAAPLEEMPLRQPKASLEELSDLGIDLRGPGNLLSVINHICPLAPIFPISGSLG